MTTRQESVLAALKRLVAEDVRTYHWKGAFGCKAIGLVAGISAAKVANDILALEEEGLVKRELNNLWRLAEK